MKARRLLRRDGENSFPPALVAAICAVLAGLTAGQLLGSRALTEASWYSAMAGLLLAVGLYGSTHEIDPGEIRQDLRALVWTVTLGVLLKAVLIAGVMIAAFREPEYLVLGIAVAQIDPLSVAAMNRSSRMSPRAKNLLSVWASFDDPVTVLLTLYFSVLAFRFSGRSGSPAAGPAGDGLAAYALSLGGNLLLFAVAVGLWWVPRRLWRRALDRERTRAAMPPPGQDTPLTSPFPRLTDLLCLLLVAAVVAVAAQTMLMLAVAVLGLVVRVGRYAALVNRSVAVAFSVAAFVLGLLLVDGVSPWRGFVLGATAFGAQILIGLFAVPRLFPDLDRADRVQLGLGQQNGITAIILALALEPDFPGTVAVVGPAILTVNTLHYTANGVWRRRQDKADRRAPDDEPAAQHHRAPHPVPGDPAGRHDDPRPGPLPPAAPPRSRATAPAHGWRFIGTTDAFAAASPEPDAPAAPTTRPAADPASRPADDTTCP
ncbi:hypothetical protein ACFWPV_33045 [Streptomyces uncialis]|uniref:hypothetical protein n=1 Tax=Streptomyces uncialis TaxID=1048205 RepID=UPI0036625716